MQTTLPPAPAPPPTPRDQILGAPRFRDAHIDRLLLSPTAETHPKGSFYVTDYEIVFLQLGYAVTDSTQISLSATPPLGEAGVVPTDLSVKTVLLRAPHVRTCDTGSDGHARVVVSLSAGDIGELRLSLAGGHQAVNAAIAAGILEAAAERRFHIDTAHIVEALTATRWPARLETVETPRGRVVIDGAHSTLYADVTSRLGGPPETFDNVDLVKVDATGLDLVAHRGVVQVKDLGTTVTADGAAAFADFYTEGTEFDPLSFKVKLAG